VEISIQENINKIFNKHLIDYVFYPDAGAMKRYSEILKFPDNVQYFYGDKKRNLQTGEIISYELINSPELIGRNVLIIDDLCSFGTTFLKCGEKLKNNAVANIFLYVSHCEDSIFKGNLLKSDVIKTVYTTDSLLSDTSHKKIIKL
jgi:ribose-phosphate pyrophosphokinase